MAQASPGESPMHVDAQAEPYPSNFYAWYGLILLFGIYLNSFLDRQILGLLVGPIRATLDLTDAQIGLYSVAFAIFYSIAGLPLGWLADRMTRKWLIFWGQMVWSIASIAFGVSRTFGQSMVARIGVGAGEATLSPSAYSLVADLFPPRKLATALSVYGMGIPIGGGIALLLGGYAVGALGVDQGVTYELPIFGTLEAWQLVFFIIAAPTIPLSLLLLTMREPLRRGVGKIRGDDGELKTPSVPIKTFLAYLSRVRSGVLLHNVGFAWLAFSGYGAGAWNAEYFIRIHDYDRASIGKIIGIITITMGPLGILFGGWLGDRLSLKHLDGKVRVGLIAAIAWIPFGLLYPLMPTPELAIAVIVPATFIASMSWGVGPAAIQEVMPGNMRGQASSVYLFIVNILGLGVGPYAIGWMTTYLFQDDNMLHYALAIVGVGAHILAAVCLVLCLPRFRQTFDALAEWQRESASS